MFEETNQTAVTFDSDVAEEKVTDSVEGTLLATARASRLPDKSVVDHYRDIEQEGTEAAASVEANAIMQTSLNLTQQLIEEQMGFVSPEETAELVRDGREALEEEFRWLNSEQKAEVVIIQQLDNVFDKQRAARMYMEKLTKQASRQEFALGSTTLDVLGIFIPDLGLNVSDITGGSWFQTVESITHMANKIKTMPAEQKVMIWPYFLSFVKDVTKDFGRENELKFNNIIATVLDEEHLDNIRTDSLLETADVATLGLSAVSRAVGTMYRAGKQYNTIKQLKNLREEEKAARVNQGIASDSTGQLAEATGVSRSEAAMNQHSLEWEKYFPGTTDGLAEDTSRLMNQIEIDRRRTQDTLNPLIEGRASIAESRLMDEKDVVAARDRAINKVEAEAAEDLEQKGFFLTKSEATTDETGINVAVTFTKKPRMKLTEDGAQVVGVGEEQVITKRILFRDTDVGVLRSPEAGAIETKLWSPEVWMNKIFDGSVEAATRVGFAQESQLGIFRKATKQALKGIGFGGRKRLNQALLDGDDMEKVFDIPTLKTQYGLSDKEVSSYYQIRDIMDTLHFMKNKQIRDILEFEGWQDVKVGLVGGAWEKGVGKAYDTIESIPADLKSGKHKVWDSNQGQFVSLAEEDLATLYQGNNRVVKFRKQLQVDEKNWTTHAIISADDLSELPTMVLNKRVGYIPKNFEDGFYFVKERRRISVDGVAASGSHTRTLRVFDNKTEADAYRNTLAAEAEQSGKTDVEFISLHDREKTFSELDEDLINEMGGTYTSPRSNREILFGAGEGEVARRANAFEAIQRNMQHISTQLPVNEFRMDMVNRWLNTARKYVDDPAKGIGARVDPDKAGGEGSPLYRGLVESQSWIRDQLRIPTNDEIRWQNTVRSFSEWMEKKAGPGEVTKFLQRAAHKDPYASMRGATFHTLLGWFNPVQLFVQAQGFAVAAGVDGIHKFPLRAKQYMDLRAAYFMKNDEAVRIYAKGMGADPDQLLEDVKLLRKSGLFDSITTTADLSAAQQGFSLAGEYVRNAARKGLLFYTEGERFTRGYSFIAALNNWRKTNPGKVVDDAAMRAILSRTVDKMLNMNRANRAYWQKGIWSVPLQFKQYTAKFMEAVMPKMLIGSSKKFTPAEKRRILGTQMLLYGAAGLGGNWILEQYFGMTGTNINDFSEEEQAMLTDGLEGLLMEITFGDTLGVGDRAAAATGITDFYRFLFTEDRAVKERVLGPFFTVGDRSMKALGSMAYLFTKPDEYEMSLHDMKKVTNEFLKIISSWNKSSKAIAWYNHNAMLSKDGHPLMSLDTNQDIKLLWAMAAGFNPDKFSQFYANIDIVKAQEQYKKDLEQSFYELLGEYIVPTNMATDDHINNYKALVKEMFEGVNPELVDDIIQKAYNRVYSEKTPYDKKIKQIIENNLLIPEKEVPEQTIFKREIN